MYQSPISIYETAMQTIIEQRDNAIFAKVQDAFDVQVDKEELIRALQYDRGQYEAGYRDGKAEAAPKWIPVSDRLPTKEDANEDGCVLVCGHGGLIEGMDLDQVTIFKELIRCWMSLPKPPKEGE